jgi:hypothetical protein
MRRHWFGILVLAATIVLVAAPLADAVGEKPIVVRAGNLILTFNGSASPNALPRSGLAPLTLHASGRIATVDGSQPPALREFILDTGKTGVIETRGVPTCKAAKIEATNTVAAERACPSAIVGKGNAQVRVEFPESTPFNADGPLVIFNGGTKAGKTLMLIHAYINVPTPTALVTKVITTREHQGPYRLHTVASIPVIAGGSGSVTGFELSITREGYLLASCPNGAFHHRATAVFRNGTEITGTFLRPCTGIG